MNSSPSPDHRPGSQRLPVQRLQKWEELGLGLFLHFGMSTFDGEEYSQGDQPSTTYAPDRLDVDQWVSVARDAGARYLILTAKHVSGHALWPTKHSDYHVGTSRHTTDVVEAFVTACAKHGVLPGLYYCSWDNHHIMGSRTPSHAHRALSFASEKYREFQSNQLQELLTQYGKLAEVWIDIPGMLGPEGRIRQYRQIAELQPDAVIMLNGGYTHGETLDVGYCWPTDLLSIERGLPCSPVRKFGYNPWWQIGYGPQDIQDYYIPGEVCDTIGWEWFYKEGDVPRSEMELLGMYLVSRARRCNFLLNVPPDRHGLIPPLYVEALQRLRKNIDRFE